MRKYALTGGVVAAIVAVVAIVVAVNSGSTEDTIAGSAPPTTVGPIGDGTSTTATVVTPDASSTTSAGPTTTLRPSSSSDSTTTTTAPGQSTTTTTTSTGAAGQPPVIAITSPGSLSRHQAVYDASIDAFAATVSFSASASDPEGGPVTIEWFGGGALGTGSSITASLRTDSDVSRPVITARATDRDGNTAEASVQIIVWIPSDQ